jgi:Bacteriocin-protection, YdeI or OmpD-Associated/Domain of unknown function (DUF1905)
VKFQSTVGLGGKSATGIPVPDEVVEKLGAGRKPAVKVTVGAHTSSSTVATMGGRFVIPLSAANRTRAGVAAGDAVSVGIELDTEPRVVTVPADFAAAMKKTPAARKQFDSLSYSNQRRWVLSVEDAKTAETRQRRIDKAVATLRDGGN